MSVLNSGNKDDSEKLVLLFERASALALAQCLNSESIEVTSSGFNAGFMECCAPVYGHWMSMTLLAAPPLTLIFKVHFFTDSVKALTSKRQVQLTLLSSVLDFMKEYCNLTIGLLKSACERAKIHAETSLPLVTRGFDEVFSETDSEHFLSTAVWKLSCQGEAIMCTARYEVADSTFYHQAESLLKELEAIQVQSGEFEIL